MEDFSESHEEIRVTKQARDTEEECYLLHLSYVTMIKGGQIKDVTGTRGRKRKKEKEKKFL